MNWYKTAQLYEDIKDFPEEYGGKGSDEFKSYQYFSIGQNEESIEKSSCWIWVNDRLHTESGITSHNMAFGTYGRRKLTNDIDNHYRGWHDPVQNMVSVVIPGKIYKEQYPYEEGDIPRSLVRALYKEFPNQPEIKVF